MFFNLKVSLVAITAKPSGATARRIHYLAFGACSGTDDADVALLGCAIGVLGSGAVSRLVSAFLFEVSATDPLIYGAGVLIMMLMASALPAIRAASADPMDTLRSI